MREEGIRTYAHPHAVKPQSSGAMKRYPETDDAFRAGPHAPRWIDVVNRVVPLAGKVVADVGSRTGESSLALAEHAAHVVGVEPEAAMRALASAGGRRRIIPRFE